MMQPVDHKGPVCGLRVYSDKFVFAGEGPTLSLYNFISGEKILSRTVLTRNKIHGIEFIGEKIAVWGGRSLTIFTLEQFHDEKFEFPILSVGDWIFHCMFENDDKLHVLNSHNIVHTIQLDSQNIPTIANTRNCGWKSILYSGSLHLDKESGKVTVLAGTVMNGIIIWDLNTCEVKHNLTEHEGSIFKVIPSPDGKYIVSCSDDRSIKVWDMESGKQLANGWGHGSRIWGLCVYNTVENGFTVFSCSEDCTARVWRFTKTEPELKQERIILGHTGRHVWSCDVNDDLKLGFTAGADGKVLVTDLDIESRVGYWGHKWELKDIASECSLTFKKGELMKEYVDFGHGLLAVTSEGNVMVLKNHKSWTSLFVDSRFERFCVLRVYENDPICVLANKHGDVIVMKFNSDCEVISQVEFNTKQQFSRLGNILLHEYDNRKFMLIESPNPADQFLYKEIDSATLEVKSSFELSKPVDKITMSSVDYDITKKYLLVGCKYATLLVYKLNQEEIVAPIVIHKNLFKGDTISSIKCLNESTQCVFYLTNKDGSYHLVKLNEDLSYEFLHTSRIQKGFLEGIIKVPNGDILLYGFKSDSFFVWNETKQYEILRELCGGSHRRWFFKHWVDNSENSFKYRFIYTRASDVQIVQNGESRFTEVLAVGLHGREVRDIATVDSLINKNEKVVVLGSEDTTLKIGTMRSDGGFELHWTYREHTGGLQSIHPVNNQYIVSSSAREELFVWKIAECDNKKCLTLDASLPPSDENPDLRIMDFDSIEIFNQNGEAIGFLLVAVYSNSVIRIVYFDFETKKFNVLVSDAYLTCCIFHVRFIRLDGKIYVMIGSTNGHLSIYDINDTISAYFELSKEQLVKVNDFNGAVVKLGKLIINQQIHQSSIKALNMITNSDSEIILVTGGDDNALIKSKIEMIDSAITLDVKSFDPNAASSTITTVSVLDKDNVLVGAVDQSIKIWNIQDELSVIEDKYSTVADVGCTDIVEFENGDKFVLIGGAGFSVWKA